MATGKMIALLLERQPYGESLAAQVNFLRRMYDPAEVDRVPVHIPLVQPFYVHVTREALHHHVAAVCSAWDPFTVQLAGIGANYRQREMYVQVARGASELIDLHLALTTGPLSGLRPREVPYFPRVTVYRAGDQESYARAFRPLRERPLEGRFLAQTLTVLERADDVWRPVEDIGLRPEPEAGP